MRYYLFEQAEIRTLYFLVNDLLQDRAPTQTAGLMLCTTCKRRLFQDVLLISTKDPGCWHFYTRCECGGLSILDARFNPGQLKIYSQVLSPSLPRDFPMDLESFAQKGSCFEGYPNRNAALIPSLRMFYKLLERPDDRLGLIVALVNESFEKWRCPAIFVGYDFCLGVRLSNELPEANDRPGYYLFPENAVPYGDGYLEYLAFAFIEPGIYPQGEYSYVTYKKMLLFHGFDPLNQRLIAGELEWGDVPQGDRQDQQLAWFVIWMTGIAPEYFTRTAAPPEEPPLFWCGRDYSLSNGPLKTAFPSDDTL